MTPNHRDRPDPMDVASRRSRFALRLRYLLRPDSLALWAVLAMVFVSLAVILATELAASDAKPAPAPLALNSTSASSIHFACLINLPGNGLPGESVTVEANNYGSKPVRGYVEEVTVGGYIDSDSTISTAVALVNKQVTFPVNRTVTIGTYPISNAALENTTTSCTNIETG